MTAGFVIGIASAVLQSLSYVLSRNFMLKHGSSEKLAVCSQIWMMLLGGAALLVISPWQRIIFSRQVLLFTGVGVVCGQCAYICFFRALQEIEASRLSALQGLKMIALAGLNMAFFREYPSMVQWMAILLASFAAVGMNFSGGRLSLKGSVYFAAALICFAGADLGVCELTAAIPGTSPLLRALAAAAFSFVVMGVCALGLLCKTGFDRRAFAGALPYGVCWFTAIALLLASFDLLGVMLGAIVQSGRGIFSVLIGFLLLKYSASAQEPPVSIAIWCRRACMAGLMIAAMFLYVR